MPIRVLVLLSLTLVAFHQFGAVEVSGPHARCTWAQEVPERLALRLREGMVLDGGNGDYSDWDSWVEAHALVHGWRNHFDGPDVIAVDRSVPCPESVLQAIASIDDLSSGPREESLHLEFALVLERNGRVDEALALLKKNAAMIHTSRPQDTFVYAARAAQESAKLCARHGRWSEAREFAQAWVPHSRCGNCIPGEERRIAESRARCSLELKLWDEARELVCAQVPHGRGVDESLLETWIAASIGSGAALNASAALEQLERCKPYAAKSYPFVHRHIEWLRLPPAERAAHLGELCADSDE
ncbi:MAG TPA: tetratricopeptide repeat protein, partial [Planctomycetota bacterium]|nr:tetratricopeptide repeat protein [Planctomycetota bacterium]